MKKQLGKIGETQSPGSQAGHKNNIPLDLLIERNPS